MSVRPNESGLIRTSDVASRKACLAGPPIELGLRHAEILHTDFTRRLLCRTGHVIRREKFWRHLALIVEEGARREAYTQVGLVHLRISPARIGPRTIA